MRVITDFDPALHGFGFPNRFQGGHVVSELAVRGRLEELIGFAVPRALSGVVSLVRSANFWGMFGLCGGMSWMALDHYLTGEPAPTQTSPPDPDSDLFRRLVGRQADSMDRRAMLARCLRWQMLPDRAAWWWPWRASVGGVTERREWPTLKLALDQGRPETLCLIRVKGVASPANHHQVVAIGYDLEASELTVHLYDPNHPRSSPSLVIQLGGQLGHRIEPRQTTGEPLRGFFVWPHRSPLGELTGPASSSAG